MCEKNNVKTALNVLYAKKEKNIPCLCFKTFLRGITSKHHNDFYCLNCLHFFSTETKRESCKKVRKNKDFCNIFCNAF